MIERPATAPAEAIEPADTEAPADEEPIEAEQEPAALVPEAADEEFAVLAEAEVDEDAVDEAEAAEAAADETAVDVAEADYAAHLEQRDSDHAPIEFTPPPRRAAASPSGFSAGGGAEQMSPDPLFDDDESPSDDDIQLDLAEIASGAAEFKKSKGFEPSPSLLRSNSDTLFGGQSVADDLARRGQRPGPEDIDLGDEEYDDETTKISTESVSESTGSAFLRGVWVVAQCILAVAFGAGLYLHQRHTREMAHSWSQVCKLEVWDLRPRRHGRVRPLRFRSLQQLPHGGEQRWPSHRSRQLCHLR